MIKAMSAGHVIYMYAYVYMYIYIYIYIYMLFLPAVFLGICIKYLLLSFVQRCKRFHRRKSGDFTYVGRVARVWVCLSVN